MPTEHSGEEETSRSSLDGAWQLHWSATGADTGHTFADPQFRLVVWNGRFVGLAQGGVVLVGRMTWVEPDQIDIEALGTTSLAAPDMWMRTKDGQATKDDQLYRGRLTATQVGSRLVVQGDVEHGTIVFSVVLTRLAGLP